MTTFTFLTLALSGAHVIGLCSSSAYTRGLLKVYDHLGIHPRKLHSTAAHKAAPPPKHPVAAAMSPLPSSADLLKRTKALAALDLILSPEWQYRYYSFNSKFAPGEQMASRRDGSGNDWHLVFDSSGWTALKGLDVDSDAWRQKGPAMSAALKKAFPPELGHFTSEPAFDWDHASFAWFQLSPGTPWVRANDLTPFAKLDAGEKDDLALLSGSAGDYVEYASEYFEMHADPAIVEKIFALEPITAEMVTTLNPHTTLESISKELFEEIGYPR